MAVENTLEERGKRYGEFSHLALISQDLKMIIHRTNGWKRLGVDQAEALDMIMHKIARILNGDPNYIDSWHDIIGYVKLIENILLAQQQEQWYNKNMSNKAKNSIHTDVALRRDFCNTNHQMMAQSIKAIKEARRYHRDQAIPLPRT